VHANLSSVPRARSLKDAAHNDLADPVLRVTCCGSRGRRGFVASNWWPTPYLWANCGPIPTFRRWRA